MRNTLKKIFIALTFILLVVSVQTYAAENIPKINFVGIDHSPLIEGDKESFLFTSRGCDKVQYRAFLYAEAKNEWKEVMPWTDAVDSNTPYKFSYDTPFESGKYKLSVWVKRAGAKGINSNKNGDYDSYYVADLNCVKETEADRVRADGNMILEKETYKVGEKVVVNGVDNLRGRKGPYTFRLHIFDVNEGKWIMDKDTYRNNPEWTPDKPGTYVLDLWGISSNTVHLSKLQADPFARFFDIWKLKVIKVEGEKSDTNPDQPSGDIKKIVLDPGHGGYDPGSMAEGYNECDGTLDIALKTREILRQYPSIKVYMTRESNKTVSLNDRADYINSIDPDASVSIHTNSCPTVPSAKGAEAWYSVLSPANEQGYKLSRLVLNNLNNIAGSISRGAKTKYSSSEPTKDYYAMLRWTSPKTIIIECAFCTNPDELELLKSDDFKTKCATAIAKSIVEYCGLTWDNSGSQSDGNKDNDSSSGNISEDILYKVFVNDVQKGAFRISTNAVNEATRYLNEGPEGTHVTIVTTNNEVVFDKTK